MHRLETPEQYDSLVERAEAEGFTLTNCFFLPAAVEQKTAAGTLYGHEVPSGVLLLDDNGGFYRCYYYLAEDALPGRIALDRDAVVEFPFNRQMNEKQLRQVGMIEAMGFHLGRESAMMSAAPKDAVMDAEGAASPCRPAGARDAAGVMALLRASFDPLYSFLPTGAELDDAIARGRVWVIREGDRVAATLLSRFEKRVASVDQIAVDAGCRRRGYGGMLMRSYHRRYAEQAASFRHWVDIHNAPAVEMYRGLGYSFGLRRANEYILRKGE